MRSHLLSGQRPAPQSMSHRVCLASVCDTLACPLHTAALASSASRTHADAPCSGVLAHGALRVRKALPLHCDGLIFPHPLAVSVPPALRLDQHPHPKFSQLLVLHLRMTVTTDRKHAPSRLQAPRRQEPNLFGSQWLTERGGAPGDTLEPSLKSVRVF